jgi:hypothetical protein
MLSEALVIRISVAEAGQSKTTIATLRRLYRILQTLPPSSSEGMDLGAYATWFFNYLRDATEKKLRRLKGIPDSRAEDNPWRKETHFHNLRMLNLALSHYYKIGRCGPVSVYAPWSRSHVAIMRESAVAEERRGVVFTDSEWEEFIAECAARSRAFSVAMTIMQIFGLRGGDLLEARLANFQKLSRKATPTAGWYFVTSGKIGKMRGTVHRRYLPEEHARKILAALKSVGVTDPEHYIMPWHEMHRIGPRHFEFTPDPTRQMPRNTFHRWFRKMCANIGFDLPHGVNTHSVRITRVTRLKEMGAHNEDVARLVGMSITNISRYDKNEAHKIGHAIDTSLLAYSLSL